MEGMVRCGANYVPLSPITFLERSALVYRDRPSIVYGSLRFTWKDTHRRCLRLASALTHFGIAPGDVVAVLAPNIPAMYELHFGVPMAGGVLCTLNIRHDSAMVSVLLEHSEAKMIFVDYELLDVARAALKLLAEKKAKLPTIIVITDPTTSIYTTKGILEYEEMLKTGVAEYEVRWPKDELDPITLNYTSGTTSSPKGVIYSHRGAFLTALAVIILNEMGLTPVYLWTVPMFHCNGWSFTWAIAAQGGTNVCLRSVIAKDIFEAIALHKVTHMSGAPTVLNMIANAPDIHKKPLPGKVSVSVGGAPPPPQILLSVEKLGFDITHSYGLTETYGPATVCAWQPEWDALPDEERLKIKSRQGLQHITMAQVDVKDPVTMKSVPSDAQTIGEVMFKGNTVMSGYLKNVKATEEAFAGGWFRTGDLGVKHSDGYIQLKDRSKDIIISGGENVSSIEVEAVLFNHPAILEAAVVSRPDAHWGETVCAFVKLKQNHEANAEDIIRFCRSRLPHYMCPKTVIFEDLPKTSTGKTQKFILKEKAKALGSLTGKIDSKL